MVREKQKTPSVVKMNSINGGVVSIRGVLIDFCHFSIPHGAVYRPGRKLREYLDQWLADGRTLDHNWNGFLHKSHSP